MKRLSIVFALLTALIIGIHPAEPQGEELLYFLSEVQLARSLSLHPGIVATVERLQAEGRRQFTQNKIDELVNEITTHQDEAIELLTKDESQRLLLLQFVEKNGIDFEHYIKSLSVVLIVFNPISFEVFSTPPTEILNLIMQLVMNESNIELYLNLTRFIIEELGISINDLGQIIIQSTDSSEANRAFFFIFQNLFTGGFTREFCLIAQQNIESKISNQSSSLWINNEGALRSLESVRELMIEAQSLQSLVETCTDAQLFRFTEDGDMVLEQIVSGQEVSFGRYNFDGSKESLQLVYSAFLSDKLEREISNDVFGLLFHQFDFIRAIRLGDVAALELLQNTLHALESCSEPKRILEQEQGLSLKYAAFASLSSVFDHTFDVIYEGMGMELPPCFSKNLTNLANLEDISQEELFQQAANGELESAIALSEVLNRKIISAKRANESLVELKQELIELTLRSTAGAAPLVTLALIEPLSRVGLD